MLEVKEPVRTIPAPQPGEVGMSIAEAAERSGVSVHTLRYYERAGLVITNVSRTQGGRRRYREVDLHWITVCTRLRATGMPIRTVKRYAELVTAGHGNEAERLALLEKHRADIRDKLEELQACLGIIEHKIDAYSARMARGDADRLWSPDQEILADRE